jgi:5-methylcytosine-specific restriction endonuclease McrA
MIDYAAIADAGGIPKPQPKKKPSGKKRKNSTISTNKGLKRTVHPVPLEVKKQALAKSAFCYAGYCPNCNGQPVTINDDPDHFPPRSRGGRDIPEHIWMVKRLCHRRSHDNPKERMETFKKIEAAGWLVDWDGEYFGRGNNE